MNGTPLAVLAAMISLVGLGAGLAQQAALLGMAAVALIVVLCLFGLRSPGRPSKRTLAALLAFGVAFCGLLALQFRLHDSAGPLNPIGGFPPGTAVLLYGIVPLGLLLGVLYGVAFDREILPLDKQREFLQRFSKR